MPALERLIAGVDEAGRGPLAGPVVAAAVILDPRRRIAGLKDSKQLTPQRRESLAHLIRARALCWAVGWAECHEIDTLNILEATHLAMRRALLGLAVCPRSVLVDGNRLPCLVDLAPGCVSRAIIKGDCTEPAISAASILAKTHRDALMRRLDVVYPGTVWQCTRAMQRRIIWRRWCAWRPAPSTGAVLRQYPHPTDRYR
ncbi:MAG: ribonuclease HII [Steroidobacteraceae bacterium]